MKKRIITDELIKDRNELAKGVYTDKEIEKEIKEHKNPKNKSFTRKVNNANSRTNRREWQYNGIQRSKALQVER